MSAETGTVVSGESRTAVSRETGGAVGAGTGAAVSAEGDVGEAVPRPLAELLTGQPPAVPVDGGRLAAAVESGPRVIVLDDDPTGTQTVAGLPVLTRWSVDDLRWALAQGAPAVFVLVNTRAMAAQDAAARDREVVRASLAAARLEGVEVVFASRGDSTLRGHFPLETDVIAEELAGRVDAVLLVPAYIDAGRVTVDGAHYLRTAEGMLPVGASEFARDATFGYRASRLPEWVEEKTAGAIQRAEVPVITLRELRSGDQAALVSRLASFEGGRPVVVDAACDDDLRNLTLALVEAERLGKRFVYRVGPSFVRARSGQTATPPIDDANLSHLTDLGRLIGGPRPTNPARPDDGLSPGVTDPARPDTGTGRRVTEPAPAHGLVVVGSHVAQTTRQLARLRERRAVELIELDSDRLLDPAGVESYVAEVVGRAVALLATGQVVLATSRTLRTAGSPEANLALSRTISAGVVSVVRGVTARVRPAFVVAKGGITSSDVATDGLGIVRAHALGTLLPGIVSLWMAAEGRSMGLPYVVFAGNVGDDEALADVVDRLRPTC
ncbi:four-carbon acid sugar kinase family protein [Nonomuraea sp. B12E4]|uniref:four-carbon acid sugar kinase family protein n=1 Tax=Nonomuraea sp. B12E4 TaxID=3153564 RepID=UPI00325F0DA1